MKPIDRWPWATGYLSSTANTEPCSSIFFFSRVSKNFAFRSSWMIQNNVRELLIRVWVVLFYVVARLLSFLYVRVYKKEKSDPLEGRSHLNTVRDDWIRTSDPLLPKQWCMFRFASLPSALTSDNRHSRSRQICVPIGMKILYSTLDDCLKPICVYR